MWVIVANGDTEDAGLATVDVADSDDPERIDQYYPTEGAGDVRRADPERLDPLDHVPFTWNPRTKGSEYIYVSDVTTGRYVFTLEGDERRSTAVRSPFSVARVRS